ncbi:MAG: hypothetical protein ACYS0D_15135, partial [Planctomycetota bacterium]
GDVNTEHPILTGLTAEDIHDLEDHENDHFTLSDAQWVIASANGNLYVVALDRGVRTVAFGDCLDHTFGVHGTPATWWLENPQLVRNAIDWLLGNLGDGDCSADLDGNGQVSTTDLLTLLVAWGPCPGCPEDLDGDDEVGTGDLLELLAQWGACEPA